MQSPDCRQSCTHRHPRPSGSPEFPEGTAGNLHSRKSNVSTERRRQSKRQAAMRSGRSDIETSLLHPFGCLEKNNVIDRNTLSARLFHSHGSHGRLTEPLECVTTVGPFHVSPVKVPVCPSTNAIFARFECRNTVCRRPADV